ncbi:hypothetical protein BJ508DRAFT_329684 [Ascobolus immersus RN42]|uniref:PiggyBac transposable element-derived protein domain-containing protein n=1 Tax=Ascobolus immersus RN42 TaxID=1160509 RepID=A0A3N4HW60_ASCIM|nr:hypothetical protein BJ508DRAFT_329684 [Ascobolus immersus RN42]
MALRVITNIEMQTRSFSSRLRQSETEQTPNGRTTNQNRHPQPTAHRYPESWKAFQESIPGAEIGEMPENYVPPRIQNHRPIPGHLHHFNPVEWDTPDTFRKDRTKLPEGFETLQDPSLYFTLFFTDEIFEFLAEMTNAYAVSKQAAIDELGDVDIQQRPWWPTCGEEIKVWIGINLYLGFLGRKNVESLWDSTNGVWQVYDYMSKTRFEQLRRFFHIYGPDDMCELPAELQPPW